MCVQPPNVRAKNAAMSQKVILNEKNIFILEQAKERICVSRKIICLQKLYPTFRFVKELKCGSLIKNEVKFMGYVLRITPKVPGFSR